MKSVRDVTSAVIYSLLSVWLIVISPMHLYFSFYILIHIPMLCILKVEARLLLSFLKHFFYYRARMGHQMDKVIKKRDSIHGKDEAGSISQETSNLSRQERLPRICRCPKYLDKVCIGFQSPFAPRFLSFLSCEIVYVLPLRWNTREIV